MIINEGGGGKKLPTLSNPGTAANLLTGKQLIDQNGNILAGTMPNQGNVSQALNAGSSYTIPAGYHAGGGKVTANSLSSQTSGTATAADIKSGKTAWVNGSRITGTGQMAGGTATVSILMTDNTTRGRTFHIDLFYVDSRGNGVYYEDLRNEPPYDKTTIECLSGSLIVIRDAGTTRKLRSDNSSSTWYEMSSGDTISGDAIEDALVYAVPPDEDAGTIYFEVEDD